MVVWHTSFGATWVCTTRKGYPGFNVWNHQAVCFCSSADSPACFRSRAMVSACLLFSSSRPFILSPRPRSTFSLIIVSFWETTFR
jgi:hypothetical protein